jgi:hypothetical protein
VVNAGTLLVNNTTGSGTGTGAVTVSNSGTTLGGTGTISGAVTVNAGANIAPGNGGNTTAILSTGALTLAATSNFQVDINGRFVAGSDYDQLNVTGTVALGGSNLVVTVGGTLFVGDTFTIISSTGAVSGMFAQGSSVSSGGNTFTITYNANDVVLTAQATPEPSTWIGGALVFAALAYTQRRRVTRLLRKAA